MMEIVKLEDVNVSIKILTINGKKMAKSYFEQIPIDVFIYHPNDNYKEYKSSFDDDYDRRTGICDGLPNIIGANVEYVTNGKFIGFLNISKYKESYTAIKHTFKKLGCSVPIGRYYSILFLDEEGKLKRSYMSEDDIEALSLKENQVFL